jgi:hypothetical protein
MHSTTTSANYFLPVDLDSYFKIQEGILLLKKDRHRATCLYVGKRLRYVKDWQIQVIIT